MFRIALRLALGLVSIYLALLLCGGPLLIVIFIMLWGLHLAYRLGRAIHRELTTPI